ncbi:TetR/AcrR family transcriptional regulator [Streptomyces sp. NPDC056653]|uniref:TetR/AcrR family transcriptional regulator n=1 Tax=Streptomyces sp. NPDC056653 TaxID=3345894 RepID=UPI003678342C
MAGAIALADAEGIDAVTIRRLAQDHGVTPMALYWHFKDKGELLDGIAERLFADVRLPTPSLGPWPQQLLATLEAVLDALRPHPEVAGLVPRRAPSSEAGLTLAEHTLALLRHAGLSTDRAAEVAGYLLNAVAMLVTPEPGREHGPDSEARDDAIRLKAASLSGLPLRRYTNVVSSAGALAACASPDAYYSLGLDMLLTGVTAIAEDDSPGEIEA